jgi:VWFA-related protein
MHATATATRTARRACFAIAAPLALALAALGIVRAQDAGGSASIAGVTELEYPYVQVAVNTEDTSGLGGSQLGPEAFAVTVDGKPADVTEVQLASSTTSPLDVLLMIDTSGSTEGEGLAQAKTAAIAFIRNLAPEDRVAIMRFANSVTVQQDFTTDKEAAVAAVQNLVARGQTELYKAAAGAINQAATSTSGRRAVVLLTDGSQDVLVTDVTAAGALALASSTGIPVFTIAQGAAIEDASFLVDLANASNGAYLEAPTPADLNTVYESVGRLLRNQYVITIDASAAAGKTEAAITLAVTSGGRTASASATFAPSPAFAAPTVAISGLTAGESLQEPREVTVTATGPQPVTRATFYVDGVNVYEAGVAPFTFTYDPDRYTEGEHSLRVAVTIGGKLIDSAPVAITSIPAAPPANAEPSGGGGGSLPVLPLALAVGGLAVVGASFLVFQRLRAASAPALTIASPDQRVTPWATSHRAITRPPAGDGEPAEDTVPPAEEIGEALGVLISRAGSDLGQEYLVGGKPVSIGSGQRCAVRISDPRLASEEARIWIRKNNLMLHRLTRLTTIAAEGVAGGWTMMDPGETFQVGDHIFEFRLLPEGAPLPGQDRPAPGDVPNILRDHPDVADRPSGPSQAPEPGVADDRPRRLADLMPREMGFSHQDIDDDIAS